MEKLKIKSFFLYGLSGLGFVLLILAAQKIVNSKALSQTPAEVFYPASTPQVLGAFTTTQTRGQNPSEQASLKPFSQIQNFDDNSVTAKSYLVYDQESGQILAQKKSGDRLFIASLTKLLTALVSYQNISLSDDITIGASDVFEIKPVLGLKAGDSVKAQDLFNAMLVGSNNDAALALAHYVAKATGQNFVSLMNQESLKLDMSQSSFSNPLGFDGKNNYSTAGDLQKLVNATQGLSAFTSLGKKNEYSFFSQSGKKFSTKTTNSLILSHPDIEAIKTGFTEGAQGSMVNKITWQGRKIIIIVLGSNDREQDTLRLKDAIESSFVP